VNGFSDHQCQNITQHGMNEIMKNTTEPEPINYTNYFLPSRKHHHVPVWLRKKIRLYMIESGEWRPCFSSELNYLTCNYGDVFDHWGSVKSSFGEIVYAQPYFGNDAKAKDFAEKMKCNLVFLPIGFHAHETVLYLFSDK
jgi:hypothetical protein